MPIRPSLISPTRNTLTPPSRTARSKWSPTGVSTEKQVDAFLARARLVASIPVITHVKSLRHHAPPAKLAMAPRPAGSGLPQYRPVFGLTSSTWRTASALPRLNQLPVDFNCPILIAQHVIPGFAAGMAKWLATESSLPIKLAEQGEPIRPGQVIFRRPKRIRVEATGDRIDLLALRQGDTYRPSCDVLLESMATVFGKRSAGIILTGMGSDGARGLARVKAAGGTTWAQDEAVGGLWHEPGGHRRRRRAGVLALDDIAAAMVQRWLRTPMNSVDLLPFQALVQQRSGLQLETLVESSLMVAVQKRMSAMQTKSSSAYYTHLLADDTEFDELVSLLTINETYLPRAETA